MQIMVTAEMLTLSLEQQRHLATYITTFLSTYKHISDAYIIEFFTEDLWNTLPTRWQHVLCELSPPQIADLLLEQNNGDRRSYPSVWPLSLLAFRTTAHTLAFPRMPRQEQDKPEGFINNQSQSSLLGHIFRKNVKPKKQHEIRKLGMLVKQLCEQTDSNSVVDVGSGQGHLTRFLSFGLGLSVTAIEADHTLVAMASKFDGQLLLALAKERQRQSHNGCTQLTVPGPSPRHVVGWVNPVDSWKAFIEQLIQFNAEGVIGSHITTPVPTKKRQSHFDLPEPAQSHPVESADCELISTAGSAQMSTQAPTYQSNFPCCKRLCKYKAENTSCCHGHCSHSQAAISKGQEFPDIVLTGLHACGDLSATLLRHFARCPHVRGITSVACCYMKLTTKEKPLPPGLVAPPTSPTPAHSTGNSEFGYPMSSWVRGLPGYQLSYKAREGACHAIEDYTQRLREESALLRTHCYRATLEIVIRGLRPELRRAGIQTIKKAHLLSFTEYARLGLARVGLPPEHPVELDRVEALLQQHDKVLVFFSLALLLAPVVETLVLVDRMIYLQENGLQSQLVPLFDPRFSPRNLVLVAQKPSLDKIAK